MSRGKTRLVGLSARRALALIGAIALFTNPYKTLAQRGARGTPGHGRPLICVYDCRDPDEDSVSSESDLKNFQRLMAMQATEDQSAAFESVVRDAQAASAQLQSFRAVLPKAPASSELSEQAAVLNKSIEGARNADQNFLAALSPAQKFGLKEITERLAKADSELDNQIKTLDRVLQAPTADAIAGSAANLDKALEGLQSAQFALADEMSIFLPSAGRELTFNLPPVTSSIEVAGQPVSIPASATASRTSVADGENIFNLKLTADLSDLQQSINDILRSQLTRSPRCGERIWIKDATLAPVSPASLVLVHLHYERWICPPPQGSDSPVELAVGDGALEVKLIPSTEQNSNLRLGSEIRRVEGDEFLRNLLLTGTLGTTLREQIAGSLLPALQKSTDPKVALPAVAHNFTTIHKAQFQENSGRLVLVLDGELRFSDDQTKEFANQLKQRLSAQQTSGQ